ncbi:MAG TPA: ABC transporter ATP-binding protein [Gaiellaceae bacterium]|nr:ABC transporter ATP-binding protein [Gaiellaceae bacterium]
MDEGERQRRDAAKRYVWRLVVRERRGVLGAIAGGLVWQAAAVTTPLVVERAIDQGILPEDRRALLFWCGALVGLGFLEAAAGGVRHFFAIRNRAHADAAVRDALFTRALELDARFHDRVGAGELMSRASNDAELVARLLDAAGHTVAYMVSVVAVAVILLTIDAPLALIVLLPLPLVSIGFWRYSRRYGDRTRRLQEELGATTALAEETVSGIRVAKGLGAGDALNARFRTASDRVVSRALDVAAVDAVFLPALEALPLLGILATLWFGSHRVLDGQMTLGQLTAFTLYLSILVWPLRTLGQRVQTLQQAIAAATRITEVLESQPAVVEARDPKRLPRGRALEVRFEDVSFGYERGRPVLDGFTLDMPPGTSVALVGGTGSGKTTAAALLARFYDPQFGRVLVDGVDVRELRVEDLRHAVGIVFEDTFLFSDTVGANIGFARPDASPEEIAEAAQLAGAEEFVAGLPEGYDTVLGERGYSLSGGQRQRLAIARAILADPAVLILDDATSAIDASKEHEIRAALSTVMEGRTTLVIAHRAATIALADRVVVLEAGSVAEQGTHAELLRRSTRYRRLLALEAA